MAWCSLQGLVSVGPFAGHRTPRRDRAASRRTGGQRALPRLWHYYEPSDSSEGIGWRFPLGYRRTYRPGRSERPGHTWTTGHQPPAGTLAHLGLLGPYEVSPDHPDGVVAACQPQPPPDAPTATAVPASTLRRPGGGVIGFRFARYVTAPGGLPAVHCSFRPTALPPPPSDPRSPGRPGHRLLELQRPKLGKDSHLLVIGTAGRTRQRAPLRAEGSLPPRRQYAPGGHW